MERKQEFQQKKEEKITSVEGANKTLYFSTWENTQIRMAL